MLVFSFFAFCIICEDGLETFETVFLSVACFVIIATDLVILLYIEFTNTAKSSYLRAIMLQHAIYELVMVCNRLIRLLNLLRIIVHSSVIVY